MKLFSIALLCFVVYCDSYKILAIFPYDGRSHHIYYSSLIEELANREHDVTVINYHPMKKLPRLRQIFIQEGYNTSDNVNIEDHLQFLSSDFQIAYDSAKAFRSMANSNCKKLMMNSQIRELIQSKQIYEVVIAEQFVTDCGLAIAYKLKAPTVGMTAHVLMPWTYSRLGAPINPSFVPNHHFASGANPNLLNRIKNAIINFGMNTYYTHLIQKKDQEIVNEVYPDVPSLEELGKNLSLVMLNQYFPLTGPRLYGPNVIEVGGMHIKQHTQEVNKNLQKFVDKSNTGVVYISFGTVATNFPRKIIEEIKKLIENNKNINFVWKIDINDWTPPPNSFLEKWMPQVTVLCHPKVVAFVTHSGMLSSSEAMHCGVPIVSVPLFGDQFANAISAVEAGLGVTIDVSTLDHIALNKALTTVLQDKYQKRAKILSELWKDRPLSPMDTAIYWIEYVARHKEVSNLKPSTIDLPLYKYFMLDLLLILSLVVLLFVYSIYMVITFINRKKSDIKERSKKKV